MAVDEQRGSGNEAGMHGKGLAGVELDEDEAVPGGTVAIGFRLEFAQEAFFELEDLDDQIRGDEGVGGGGGIGEQDVFKLIGARGQDGGTFVDFDGIKQVENGKMLDGQDFVHALEAEAAFSVEEVRDMGLLKSGLLG